MECSACRVRESRKSIKADAYVRVLCIEKFCQQCGSGWNLKAAVRYAY